ncbi:aldo/keto reductase [Clostridium sporogenes]|uniref:aldo/keto reductase n=1 Tax=Clostridium TaxID=1485 RepID=UPI000DFCBD32|nr:aldo/keto reductase [Clostridium sporogenes]STC77289.1 aldo/keto reductase family oxidoreductase [Clostridium botulinum]MCW6107769.1 aldo/keto reductase [Clostridium sporogenes]NFF66092.1 aldo/keto reductase [Clostridium sporogenes]NFF99148.1 aldo/keto reductase [Clostridium sporogenes]NFG06098.1 aldo/keto reductase [Clostridium sporogenes]
MLYRKLGKTDEEVSILGFGCMRLPITNNDPAKIDEKEAIKQIRYAIDNGVNYIDTAYPYHEGASEFLVEKALRDGYRERVKLATKLPSWLIKSREDMDKYLNEQLQKLQTDHIDFYLLHALNKEDWENLKKHNVFEFLDKAIEDGRIKYAGFSFHDELPLFKEIVDAYDWTFCQIQYNFIDENYQAGTKGLKYASQKGLAVIIMEPLRGGNLARVVPDDVKKLWNKAHIKRSPAQWGFRFLWNHPEITVVLSGMEKMDHIKENIRESNNGYANSLTEKELQLINEVKEIYISRIKVDCTNCRYCMPCPFGVNIPKNFKYLNMASIYSDVKKQEKKYVNHLNKNEKASNCRKCGKCEEACPQNIKIRNMLEEVVKTFEP